MNLMEELMKSNMEHDMKAAENCEKLLRLMGKLGSVYSGVPDVQYKISFVEVTTKIL